MFDGARICAAFGVRALARLAARQKEALESTPRPPRLRSRMRSQASAPAVNRSPSRAERASLVAVRSPPSVDLPHVRAARAAREHAFKPLPRTSPAARASTHLGKVERPQLAQLARRAGWGSPGFTGHNQDNDLGLVDMKGRLYDPAIRRFHQRGSVRVESDERAGWDRYVYVENNPLAFVDPSGFSPRDGDYRVAGGVQPVDRIAWWRECTAASDARARRLTTTRWRRRQTHRQVQRAVPDRRIKDPERAEGSMGQPSLSDPPRALVTTTLTLQAWRFPTITTIRLQICGRLQTLLRGH